MKRRLSIVLCIIAAGCATANLPNTVSPGMQASEVASRMGKPIAEGRLPNDDTYWDYTLQPRGFHNYRVTFGPDERVRDVRDLLTEENIRKIRPGMTPEEVAAILGPSREVYRYGNQTIEWNYRYRDYEIIKLLHVLFAPPANRVDWFYSEWDPNVYSKGDGKGKGGK